VFGKRMAAANRPPSVEPTAAVSSAAAATGPEAATGV
jgi:hypothetical protein